MEALKDGLILLRLMQSLTESDNIGITEKEILNLKGNKFVLQTSVGKIIEFIKVTIRRSGLSVTCSSQSSYIVCISISSLICLILYFPHLY